MRTHYARLLKVITMRKELSIEIYRASLVCRMAFLAKDVLCASDNEDSVAQEPATRNFNRGAKNVHRLGVSRKVTDKSKKTNEVSDDSRPLDSGLGNNQLVTEELTTLTARDLPSIVDAVVKSFREENHRDTEEEEPNDPPLPG